MNATIVTQSAATVNVAPVNWERSTERNHNWHAKTLDKLSKQAAQRRQREAQLIADNAAWCAQMGFDPSLAAEIFA